MSFDPNELTPSGKTFAQIDAEQRNYVDAANRALVLMRAKAGRWWCYSVSHSTFEMVVGDPQGADNLVLCLIACEHVAGPVNLPQQQLEVIWHCNRDNLGRAWEFVLQDESAGFRVVAGGFRWRRNFDLLTYRSLYFGPGLDGATPLSVEQAESQIAKYLRLYARGSATREELITQVTDLLSALPMLEPPTA